MQIRAQLRRAALFLSSERPACCIPRVPASGTGWTKECRAGYHGKYTRVRFKSRARDHGNAVGQSKQHG